MQLMMIEMGYLQRQWVIIITQAFQLRNECHSYARQDGTVVLFLASKGAFRKYVTTSP